MLKTPTSAIRLLTAGTSDAPAVQKGIEGMTPRAGRARSERRDFAARRVQMVQTQIAGRGITDIPMLHAMGTVPREAFVPESVQDNVHVLHGDGMLGWAEHTPYDTVIVTAGAPRVPPALLEQLAGGGRLMPREAVRSARVGPR